MLSLIPHNDFELIKKAIEKQMIQAVNDVDTLNQLADLNQRLNDASGVYIDQEGCAKTVDP